MDNQYLSEFKCHFTWDFINLMKRTKLYLRDRINTIDKELLSQNEGSQRIKRNLPQLYSLRGYLYVQLYLKTEDGGQEFLTEAETSFKEALKECNDENVGYRSVIYADNIHFEHKWRRREPTESIEKYRGLSKDIVNHPEILAMKGYAASLFRSYEIAIQFYETALKNQRNAEWEFGLALLMQRRNFGRSAQNESKPIEDLFRKVFSSDPTNYMARLKLAKQLWNNKERREENEEEIKNLLEGINSQDNTTLLVKKADLLCQMHPNTEQAETLLTKALVKYPNSNEILRGLGHVYFKRWHADKTDESNLEEAIKYFTMIVDKESINDMNFDLTMIGYVHLQASKYYLNKNRSKYEEHSEKLKKWMEKAEERLSKEQYDLKSSIETSYRLSQYYKHKSELEEEKRYLRDTLIKANEGSEEDKFHELKYFIEAKLRLLEVANYYSDETDDSDETEISWVFEQSYEFDKAIHHLREAMSKCWDESKLKDMYEREALLLSKQVEKEMKNDNESQLFDKFNEKDREQILRNNGLFKLERYKVEKLHDCEMKWNLTFEIRKMKIEKSMFDEQNLRELKEKSLLFEACLLNRRKGEAEIHELNGKVCEVIIWLCTVLDRAIMHIKNELYKDEGTKNYNLQFPRPSLKELKYDADNKLKEGTLKKLFENKWKWEKFCETNRSIFKFFVARLSIKDYPFLTKVFTIRNVTEHRLSEDMIKTLNKECPEENDKIELARKASKYATEVWCFVKNEVGQTPAVAELTNDGECSHNPENV